MHRNCVGEGSVGFYLGPRIRKRVEVLDSLGSGHPGTTLQKVRAENLAC